MSETARCPFCYGYPRTYDGYDGQREWYVCGDCGLRYASEPVEVAE